MLNYYTYVCISVRTTMSLITTLSVKEEHKTKYYTMRNWLKQRNMSMGDYIIGKFDDEFSKAQATLLTK